MLTIKLVYIYLKKDIYLWKSAMIFHLNWETKKFWEVYFKSIYLYAYLYFNKFMIFEEVFFCFKINWNYELKKLFYSFKIVFEFDIIDEIGRYLYISITYRNKWSELVLFDSSIENALS